MRPPGLLLVLAGLASPPAFAGEKADLGRKLLETSGLKAQVEQLPEALESSLKERRGQTKLSPEELDTFVRILRNRFAASSFYPVLEERFIQAIDEKALREVDRWYQSPLARKVTELEERLSRPGAQAEIQGFARELRTSPPAAGRVKLVRRLDQAVGGTETMVEMTVGIATGMASGLKCMASGKVTRGMSDKELRAVRARLRPVFREMVQVAYLMAYQSLSDQELKEYLKFASTPAAKAFYRAMAKAYRAAFEEASTQIGRDLVRVFGRGRKSARK